MTMGRTRTDKELYPPVFKLMKYLYSSPVIYIAEAIGFEPMGPFGPPVFKTGAIDHSAKPPNRCLQACIQPLCHSDNKTSEEGFEPPDPLLSFMWANHKHLYILLYQYVKELSISKIEKLYSVWASNP